MLQLQQIATQWINDKLDLYNYAAQLGDTEWQREIAEQLRNKDALISLETKRLVQEDLWGRFDDINRRMLSLYQQIKECGNKDCQRELQEKAWELKRERMLIGQKLRKQEALRVRVQHKQA